MGRPFVGVRGAGRVADRASLPPRAAPEARAVACPAAGCPGGDARRSRRDRGVRCRNPSWSRYGSTTSSTVSGSSPTEAARVEPDRTAAETLHDRLQDRVVETVEAFLVDLEHLEAGPGNPRPRSRRRDAPRRSLARGGAAGSRCGRASDERSRPHPARRAAPPGCPRTARRCARDRRPGSSRAEARTEPLQAGRVMRPGRVVAATSVNLGSSSRIDLAVGPLPSTTSSTKSSSAGYRTSSTGLGMRWTSSTKRTSPSSRFVRIAARSLGRSRAGPLVGWNPAPIAFATICASVVLPSPGGPLKSRWSTGSPRRRAPSISSWSCSFTRSCPTKSVATSAARRRRTHDLPDRRRRLRSGIRRPRYRPTFCSASRSMSSRSRPSASTSRVASAASCGVRPSRTSASRTSTIGPPSLGSSDSPPSRSRRSTTTRCATLLPTPVRP